MGRIIYLMGKSSAGKDTIYKRLLEDGALDRELSQEKPQYKEMCRRFLADSEDFSEEKIRDAGIERRFENTELEDCLEEIRRYIMEEIPGK